MDCMRSCSLLPAIATFLSLATIVAALFFAAILVVVLPAKSKHTPCIAVLAIQVAVLHWATVLALPKLAGCPLEFSERVLLQHHSDTSHPVEEVLSAMGRSIIKREKKLITRYNVSAMGSAFCRFVPVNLHYQKTFFLSILGELHCLKRNT
jgi:hypothetical protein